MNSVEMFGTAKWLGTEECAAPYIRGFFEIEQIEKAVLPSADLVFLNVTVMAIGSAGICSFPCIPIFVLGIYM